MLFDGLMHARSLFDTRSALEMQGVAACNVPSVAAASFETVAAGIFLCSTCNGRLRHRLKASIDNSKLAKLLTLFRYCFLQNAWNYCSAFVRLSTQLEETC